MKASAVAPDGHAGAVVCRRRSTSTSSCSSILLALAFQADITRVGTLLFARDLTGRRIRNVKLPRRVSMAYRITAKIRGESRIYRKSTSITSRCWRISSQSWQQRMMATEPCWTIRWFCSVEHGKSQPASALRRAACPVGGLNWKTQGRTSSGYPSKTVPTGNLLLSILDMYDIHQDSIGDSTGRLDKL
jgi:hypothetical protein